MGVCVLQVDDRSFTPAISQRVPAVCSAHTDNLRWQEFCCQWTSRVEQFTCGTAFKWRHGRDFQKTAEDIFCLTVLTISYVDSYRDRQLRNVSPIAVETFRPLKTSACQLFGNLGRKISLSSGDDREGAFLLQRVSVLVQRFNAVLLHDSLPNTDCTDW